MLVVCSARNIGELEALIGYSFTEPQNLVTAMTHRSYANERRPQVIEDNEKFEFLGDAVLDLVIGYLLMQRFPELGEGALSMTRAQMVSEAGLSKVARKLELGAWLRLGKGETQSGGRQKASLLADALEAICAALYIDGGLTVAEDFIKEHFEGEIPSLPGEATSDHKTRLQELVQGTLKTVPVYKVVGESGPDHAKTFEVAVLVADVERARATGRSKKLAEQSAAALAVEVLLGEGTDQR